MNLMRGMPVIINDVDCPEGKMIAVLSSYDHDNAVWHALYLSTATRGSKCSTKTWTPTRLCDFGVRIEWKGDEYRVIRTGEGRAKYEDGVPREWQDRSGREWFTSRSKARALLRMDS